MADTRGPKVKLGQNLLGVASLEHHTQHKGQTSWEKASLEFYFKPPVGLSCGGKKMSYSG